MQNYPKNSKWMQRNQDECRFPRQATRTCYELFSKTKVGLTLKFKLAANPGLLVLLRATLEKFGKNARFKKKKK